VSRMSHVDFSASIDVFLPSWKSAISVSMIHRMMCATRTISLDCFGAYCKVEEGGEVPESQL